MEHSLSSQNKEGIPIYGRTWMKLEKQYVKWNKLVTCGKCYMISLMGSNSSNETHGNEVKWWFQGLEGQSNEGFLFNGLFNEWMAMAFQ